MQVFSPKRQMLLASLVCYAASWCGIGLGLMWLWLGYESLGHDVARNAIFNPVLMFDGALVITGSILIARKNKPAVVFVTCYAIFMELFLQWYQWHYRGFIKPKPYFGYELAGLLLANLGVFWYHHARGRLKHK